MSNVVYVVTMQRWGQDESHNYIEGVYTDLALAAINGLRHSNFRADKYTMKIDLARVNLESGRSIQLIPNEVAINMAKLKYPEKFDDRNNLIEE